MYIAKTIWLLLAIVGAGLPATIDVYISAPGQMLPIPQATYEDFDSLVTGNRTVPFQSVIGEYGLGGAVAFNIHQSDQYGGANNSKYMVFGQQSSTSAPIPLKFREPETYFGFWWSAGDPNNRITLYSGSAIVAQFSTSIITTALAGSNRITAIDGRTRHKTAEYFGKPGSGANSGEPYAYLFFNASTPMFTSVLFDNLGTTGTGFESDNHAVYRGVISVPGTSVRLSTYQVADPVFTPEPGTLLLVGGALFFLSARFRRPSHYPLKSPQKRL